ncbi:MAG: ABC transporter permease, partial [Cyclobacteriaceae bacterium]|nr:ABC transporter permease [Cyclobacteriaceae bacterium]
AVVIIYVSLPSLNIISGKVLVLEALFQPQFLMMALGLILFVGLMAGSYPAFYLTSFEVTDVLKGQIKTSMKSGRIRSALVTFQFWISIMLIICTTIVYGQLSYVQNKNIGLDKDRVIYIDGGALKENKKAYKDKLKAFSQVENVSFTSNAFPNINNNSLYRGVGKEDDHILGNYRSDYDQLKTLGLSLKEGRFFSKEFLTDTAAVVINEATVREMGWDKPLEEYLSRPTGDLGGFEKLKVIGVVHDFNFESLKDKVRPMVIHLSSINELNMIAVRFKGNTYQEVLGVAENEWKELAPSEPFEFTFLSEKYDELFRSEQRLGLLFSIFTGFAIFIACLGLFGLTAFSAEQRTKEIGVRKVLGATVWEINTLLTKEFTKLVLLAFVIAVYPAYYIMSNWLNNFEYRVDIGVWVFLVAGVSALVISWITVSFQAQKAARSNPVNALKYE